MTIHPLLRLAASEPHLLAQHAEAYAALVADEAGKASAGWLRRATVYAAAAVLAVIGVTLGGVALLIVAAVPSSGYPAPWALIVVPLVPVAIALVLIVMARSHPVDNAFDTLKSQFEADKALIRELSTS